MPEEPQIRVLSYKKRLFMFWTLFAVFLVALPALIFYTSGNRLIFGDEETNIISMGGIYLGNDLDDIEVYIDETQIEKSRLFRRALYLEDISAGLHRIHVQLPGLQTWVKELPVFPGIVTETFSFNLPTTPQVRLISEYLGAGGEAVIFGTATTTNWWPEVELINPLIGTTTKLTTEFTLNPEYEYVTQLFAATTTAKVSLVERMQAQFGEQFSFSSATTSVATTSVATTTVSQQNIRLREHQGELLAEWLGQVNDSPFYFCVRYDIASSTAARYGAHVAKDVLSELASSSAQVNPGDRFCRQSIQLNRLAQDVYLFDFLPGSSDLVLLQLEDGLYVTEIDDRAWQNTQLLYPGAELNVIIDNGQILIFDGERYFEVSLTLDASS